MGVAHTLCRALRTLLRLALALLRLALPQHVLREVVRGAGTLIRGGYYLRRFAEDYGVPFFLLLALLGRPAATGPAPP